MLIFLDTTFAIYFIFKAFSRKKMFEQKVLKSSTETLTEAIAVLRIHDLEELMILRN